MTPLSLALPLGLRSQDVATTDQQLVESARHGRADAFDALLTRHHATARAIAGRILRRDASGLEDVLAEAACRAWIHLPRLRDGVRFRAWYCTIVRNAALDYAYKCGRERGPESTEAQTEESGLWWDRLADDDPTPSERMESEETYAILREAVGALEELYAVPLRRRCLDEASYQEIADELGKPVGTVKCLVHRGKALIEARLRSQNVLV